MQWTLSCWTWFLATAHVDGPCELIQRLVHFGAKHQGRVQDQRGNLVPVEVQSGSLWVHMAPNFSCALGCFISLQEIWWFWDCCLHISEVSFRIYFPQTQSSSKIQSAGEERMPRKYLWERWEKKTGGGKKRQNLTGFKNKDFSSKFTYFICKILLPRSFA